jgi:hypothetical protein
MLMDREWEVEEQKGEQLSLRQGLPFQLQGLVLELQLPAILLRSGWALPRWKNSNHNISSVGDDQSLLQLHCVKRPQRPFSRQRLQIFLHASWGFEEQGGGQLLAKDLVALRLMYVRGAELQAE